MTGRVPPTPARAAWAPSRQPPRPLPWRQVAPMPTVWGGRLGRASGRARRGGGAAGGGRGAGVDEASWGESSKLRHSLTARRARFRRPGRLDSHLLVPRGAGKKSSGGRAPQRCVRGRSRGAVWRRGNLLAHMQQQLWRGPAGLRARARDSGRRGPPRHPPPLNGPRLARFATPSLSRRPPPPAAQGQIRSHPYNQTA